MDMGEWVDSVARPARCCPYDARHFARHSCPPLLRPPPFPFVLLCPRFCPLGVLLGSTWLLVGLLPGRVGGGGALDAGSGPSLRDIPHRGADACTPRQGVTLLYGPSICTRSVQMDLRRNQVRRPFPTPGSGTLWVSGESLRDRRVSCLPQRTVCPACSPSQDPNRSTCRGECSWSGPLTTPPGRCHRGPLAYGPGRNPPYCLRSGGADTDTGGGPKPLRSGTSPASFAGSCHPSPPPLFSAVLVPAFGLPSAGVSPFPAPLAVLPGSCRVPSVPAVCPCSGALVSFVFFSSTGLSSAPPHVPSLSPRRGGGAGASSLPVLWRKHLASTVQARGAALVPRQVRGGLAVWLLSSPYLPCGRTPGGPLVGAFTAHAPFGHGLVVRVAPSLCRLPTLPLCPRGGSAFRYRHPRPSGGRWCVGGGGAPLSSSLCSTHVAGTTQARRKHRASHLAAVGGRGFPFGAPPIPPRSGTSPASLAGPCCPGLPPFVAVLVLASSLSSPGALVCFVLCFFLFVVCLHRPPPVSPPGASVCPLPPPMSPPRLLAVLAPFLGGWG